MLCNMLDKKAPVTTPYYKDNSGTPYNDVFVTRMSVLIASLHSKGSPTAHWQRNAAGYASCVHAGITG